MPPDPWRIVLDRTGHADGYPIVIELRIEGKLPRDIFETQSLSEAKEWASRFMSLRGFGYTTTELSQNRTEYTPVPNLTTQQGG